ncbi:tRNA (adenosine(37)-N6)-dimethylallyltransferase MiaA [Campylobacter upsaliensis]|nr:tRNA (adenosine(37)-N6)-dimethylallyltransferase MiaA [Campylobacter upsaliensis]EAI7128579.1 tRNA (adenosine(37)-N6)-dimethylallyltransferase MiaA [Campylobacter upsaliensis]EAK3352880.1 tRNA (adenosine(37)-N6)-dimethylallyltransferase MiaA [Campylobacter upsaliensis]ECL3870612.1 tRNA (adenosine(37)-N6)-dimethylallyltransferase MiaA [Campylobacter upsaliensis]EFC8623270.1 tRNA (adenosine(37)-N6)-dimethylallyltransferase MiaA [Campylobacter upsaliensis]
MTMFFEFALIGTTASGKTALANALALKFNAVILSLDSLCVYKEINIANAKVEKEILEKIDYFGVNLLSVWEHFNVGLFIKEYQKAKEFAKNRQKPLIITGGTSFYLKMMMEGLSDKVEEVETKLNNSEIYTLCLQIDPEFKVAQNDSYRLKKWLNIYESTREIPSKFLQRTKKEGILKELEIYELCWDKEELAKNIRKRTKLMLKQGLIEEARELFTRFDANLKPLNSIGLKECKAYLNDEISLKELEILINTHTAQLAKRQRTFNKKFQSTPLSFHQAFEFLSKKFN